MTVDGEVRINAKGQVNLSPEWFMGVDGNAVVFTYKSTGHRHVFWLNGLYTTDVIGAVQPFPADPTARVLCINDGNGQIKLTSDWYMYVDGNAVCLNHGITNKRHIFLTGRSGWDPPRPACGSMAITPRTRAAGRLLPPRAGAPSALTVRT